MAHGILKRTTFLVPDAEATSTFYENVFGWTRWYDNRLPVDYRFPPAAPDGAEAHLIILKVEDPTIGMMGIMQYIDPPYDTAVPTNRSKVSMGETILVISSDDVEGVHERAKAAGANIVSPPTDWEVPSHDGQGVIKLRILSMFDIDGRYMEVTRHRD